MLDTLIATGPHPSLGDHADTYGRLIGSWHGEYRDFSRSGQVATGSIEVHFAWVLQGLAVQDVWIAPSREQRALQDVTGERDTYGSTLRVFYPDTESWRVTWINPQKHVHMELTGRRVGDDIIQTGFFDGKPIKWQFTNITDDAFLWRAFSLEPDGVTWYEETRFTFVRVP